MKVIIKRNKDFGQCIFFQLTRLVDEMKPQMWRDDCRNGKLC